MHSHSQNRRHLHLIAMCFLLLGGCMAKKWESPALRAHATPDAETCRIRLAKARTRFQQADSESKLRDSMAAYQAVLESDPDNYEALALLGNQYILLGTAYTSKRAEKKKCFHEAMRYCELAMATNQYFRNRIDAGAKPWEAAESLTSNEAEAMLFWATALQYEFNEVMPLPMKIINHKWLDYSLTFLNRAETVRPGFGGGSLEFGKTICYSVLPRRLGGDPEQATEYMERAVNNYPGHMLGHWARGKYYHKIKGNRKERQKDLEWVADAQLADYADPYPWRVHFQQDARRLLDR